jgi:hypothetical protein
MAMPWNAEDSEDYSVRRSVRSALEIGPRQTYLAYQLRATSKFCTAARKQSLSTRALDARSVGQRLAQNQQSMKAARILFLLQEFVERLRSIAIAMLVRDMDLPACIFQAASFQNRGLRSQPQCLHQVSVFGSVDREGHCRLLALARPSDHKRRA